MSHRLTTARRALARSLVDPLSRRAAHALARFHAASPSTRAVLWAMAAGLCFATLNTLVRLMTTQLPPLQAQFLRYVMGLLVMLPWVFAAGFAAYRPNGLLGQFGRGAVHTIGLMFWFVALPHLPIADTTALGFTTPIFTMLGAAWMLRERISWQRWAAAVVGFGGVLIVVGPKLGGSGGVFNFVMLASAPFFAASFLITKVLTRRDSPQVIVVWQAITVSLFSLPVALALWVWPTPAQWFAFLVAGALGSMGHFCLTHSFKAADLSTTTSVKFLDLLWASLWGFVIFGDLPSAATWIGGGVILAVTLWIVRHESRVRDDEPPG